mmetsp:Transcript_2999/g.6312  ORF Transcript_2999/g.6312 Transcript_2999/m.6312 type:complete len:317 (+) Transcript_2999:149-1099(+)
MDSHGQESFVHSLSAIHKDKIGNAPILPQRGNPRRTNNSPYSLQYPGLPKLPFQFFDDEGDTINMNPNRLTRRHSLSCSKEVLQTNEVNTDLQKSNKKKWRKMVSDGDNRDGSIKKTMPKAEVVQGIVEHSTKQSHLSWDEKQKHRGYRDDYTLGDAVRSPFDLVSKCDKEKSLQSVSSLFMHDFAFIKRSDGDWTYAVLALRSFETVKGDLKECMTFVVNSFGAMKTIDDSQWGNYIRLVSCKNKKDNATKPAMKKNEPGNHSRPDNRKKKIVPNKANSWVPKKIIVPRNNYLGDDYSIISNVSDPKLNARHKTE